MIKSGRWMAFVVILAARNALALDLTNPSAVGGLRTKPVRFLLTFDDGPYGQERNNPTELVLNSLAVNAVQNDMKAIFFLQTRSSDGGATERGRALMQREHAEGHILALHDGSTWGHRSHRNMDDEALEKSLSDGITDLLSITGRPVNLLRPPYWAYDIRTVTAYERHGLNLLLTDISANDGKDWGFKASPRRVSHMASEMANVRARILRDELPIVDGVIPVLVAFHDTNTYTAGHMHEYFDIVIEAAKGCGLLLDTEPFYTRTAELERAALIRARDVEHRRDMVPWWWRVIHWLFMASDHTGSAYGLTYNRP